MIRLKDISWIEEHSQWTDGKYYNAIINGYQFLCIPEVDGKYYIHTTSEMFKVSGNKGIEEWGWFDKIDDCKNKAEEIITTAILSFIDMRDYKIDSIVNE